MYIDYISDLHLDFYVEPLDDRNHFKQATQEYLSAFLPKVLGDALVIAGDLSHYDEQSFDILEYFSQVYSQVFFVLGNHDYYLVSRTHSYKYSHSSLKREEKLVDDIQTLSNVTLLKDFEVVTFKDKRIAGSTSWYPLATFEEKHFFDATSNDSRLIKGMKIHELHFLEQKAYDEMSDVDLIVTHLPSITLDSHRKYGNTACYLNSFKEMKAPVWIFGHCHEQTVIEKAGHLFAINAIGYPGENNEPGIKTIQI